VYSGVQLLVLLYVFTFLVLCSVFCDVHYDCHIKRCSVRLYSQLLLGGLMSYLCYLCLLAYSEIKHVLYIWVTWRVSYKRQELLTLRELLCSPSVFWWGPVAHLLSFLYCIVLCFNLLLFYLSLSCVFYTLFCQYLWIVHFWLPFGFLWRLFKVCGIPFGIHQTRTHCILILIVLCYRHLSKSYFTKQDFVFLDLNISL
jgi:hypothetical protein